MARTGISLKPARGLTPGTGATEIIKRRRRSVLVEAGIKHTELAKILSRGRRALSRSAITNLLGGHYASKDYILERRLVEEVQNGLRRAGLNARADEITMEYLGWPSTMTETTMAGS